MNITTSNHSEYCAHCGHIEPLDEPDELGTPLIFVHLDDCRCFDNAEAHVMFNALANAMIHMKSNDCLLRRAKESITTAMQPFADEYLSDNSFSYRWLTKDMELK